MYNPHRRGMSTAIPTNTSLPPPAALSGTTFVSRFLLVSIAIVAAIALIVTAPLSVTGPLGFVFLAGLFGTYVLSALERRQQGRGEPRSDAPSDVNARRGKYLKAASTLILRDLQSVASQWRDSKEPNAPTLSGVRWRKRPAPPGRTGRPAGSGGSLPRRRPPWRRSP